MGTFIFCLLILWVLAFIVVRTLEALPVLWDNLVEVYDIITGKI